jgi:predicted transcriptional regulator
MTTQLNSTLPERQPKRALMFSIRLTKSEQDEIDALAKRLNLPSSFMARHFILEAVAYHRTARQGDRVEGETQST